LSGKKFKSCRICGALEKQVIGRRDEVSDAELVGCDWAAGPRKLSPDDAVLRTRTRMFDSKLDDDNL
jgi:hypothetical protein